MNAQDYKGTRAEIPYRRALDNAEKLAIHAKILEGAEKLDIGTLLRVIERKRELLNMGKDYKPHGFRADPKTAKIIEKKKDNDKKYLIYYLNGDYYNSLPYLE